MLWIFILLLRGTRCTQQGPHRQEGQEGRGPPGPRVQRAGSELHAQGEGNETVLVRDLALLLSVTNAIVLKGVLPRDGTHALSPCGRHPS